MSNKRHGTNLQAKGVELQAKKVKIQRAWKPDEVERILEYLKATVKKGKMLEKPTADQYYQKMLPVVDIDDCSLSQLKNKVKNLKIKYLTTIQWRNEKGQGVLENEGEEKFKKATDARCPFYDDLDEIYGIRTSIINPPPEVVLSIDELSNLSDVTNDAEIDHSLQTIQKGPCVAPTSCGSNSRTKPPLSRTTQLGCGQAFAAARNQRTALDNRKMDLEVAKLEFEKQKWQDRLDIKRRRQQLEEQRVRNESANTRFEIEMKYKTQLEIAKLSHSQNTND